MDFKALIEFNKYTLALAAACIAYALEKFIPALTFGDQVQLLFVLGAFFASALLGVVIFATATAAQHPNRADTRDKLAKIIAPLGTAHTFFLVVGLLVFAWMLYSRVMTSPGGPTPPLVNNSASASCCTGMAGDIAAIRRSIEAVGAGTPLVGSAASAPTSRVIAVPAEGLLQVSGWAIAGVGLFLLSIAAGVTLLVTKGSTAQKAVGASLLAVGTLTGGGFALVKDVKVDSIFSIDVEKVLDKLRIEIGQFGGIGPERLGSVDKFKLGDGKLVEGQGGSFSSLDKLPTIQNMAAAWLKGRVEGKNAVLLIVGATDRLPIAGEKSRQYDANVGLGMARAEAVKRALLDACAEQAKQRSQKCDLRDEQIIVLVSGPRNTPEAADTSSRASREGYPEDRRVDVWALWTRNGVGLTIGR
ncbi:hypothetical protein ACPOLB_03745 [Rubrivivax sp. RP6-9]|uniref:hypothetical protein n=1 Tax=Rubrivivax sp. RP6-9 TaxID=3415750 RepID=UPI003CC66B82